MVLFFSAVIIRGRRNCEPLIGYEGFLQQLAAEDLDGQKARSTRSKPQSLTVLISLPNGRQRPLNAYGRTILSLYLLA